MMANTAGLTKKGAPPPRGDSVSPIRSDPRVDEARKQPLQEKIPMDIHTAFSARAGEEFGFTSGSKTKLFLAMWEAYNRR